MVQPGNFSLSQEMLLVLPCHISEPWAGPLPPWPIPRPSNGHPEGLWLATPNNLALTILVPALVWEDVFLSSLAWKELCIFFSEVLAVCRVLWSGSHSHLLVLWGRPGAGHHGSCSQPVTINLNDNVFFHTWLCSCQKGWLPFNSIYQRFALRLGWNLTPLSCVSLCHEHVSGSSWISATFYFEWSVTYMHKYLWNEQMRTWHQVRLRRNVSLTSIQMSSLACSSVLWRPWTTTRPEVSCSSDIFWC